MAVAPGESPVDDLDCGDLDDPMTLLRIEAGGFGVEDQVTHRAAGFAQRSGLICVRL